MMYPILCKVKFETLHQTFSSRDVWIQIGFSIIINWILAPLIMVSLSIEANESELTSMNFSLHSHGHSCRTNLVCAKG